MQNRKRIDLSRYRFASTSVYLLKNALLLVVVYDDEVNIYDIQVLRRYLRFSFVMV